MEVDSDVSQRFLAELKSYAPVVLPTLLVYGIESRAHLKVWHAVRQLPHLEKEPSADDIESYSNFSSAQIFEIRAKRDAVNKQAWSKRISKIVFGLVLMSIVFYDQYVKLSGWLNRSKAGEEFDGYIGDASDFDSETETQSGVGYGWYYYSTLGQINWAKSYYLLTLLLPAVLLLVRFIYLVSGLKDRVILRNTKNVPFIVSARSNRISPRRPGLVALTVTVVSAAVAVGALAYQSTVCSILLFMSLLHVSISNISVRPSMSLKAFISASVVILVIIALFIWQWFAISTFPIRILRITPHPDETNWSGLILTAMVCASQFSFLAMCYRMDHAFARPDELLVGKPDTAISKSAVNDEGETVQLDIVGTRVTYCPRSRRSSSCSSGTGRCRFDRRLRWPKPYFRTSILALLITYALIAYFKVKGYIETDAEMAGLFALYFAPQISCIAIVLRAAAGGRDELKKVWAYNEDWVGKEILDTGIEAVRAESLEESSVEGKVLLSEEKEHEKSPVEA